MASSPGPAIKRRSTMSTEAAEAPAVPVPQRPDDNVLVVNVTKEVLGKYAVQTFSHDSIPYVVKDKLMLPRSVASHLVKKSRRWPDSETTLEIKELSEDQRRPDSLPTLIERSNALEKDNAGKASEIETLKKKLAEAEEKLKPSGKGK